MKTNKYVLLSLVDTKVISLEINKLLSSADSKVICWEINKDIILLSWVGSKVIVLEINIFKKIFGRQ